LADFFLFLVGVSVGGNKFFSDFPRIRRKKSKNKSGKNNGFVVGSWPRSNIFYLTNRKKYVIIKIEERGEKWPEEVFLFLALKKIGREKS